MKCSQCVMISKGSFTFHYRAWWRTVEGLDPLGTAIFMIRDLVPIMMNFLLKENLAI